MNKLPIVFSTKTLTVGAASSTLDADYDMELEVSCYYIEQGDDGQA